MSTYHWNNQAEQRAAARKFLTEVLTNDQMRKDVLADRRCAWEKFKAVGDIDLPEDVEVICVGPSTQERAKLVVFALPEEGTPIDPPLDPLKYWLAAWFPYGPKPEDSSPAASTPRV